MDLFQLTFKRSTGQKQAQEMTFNWFDSKNEYCYCCSLQKKLGIIILCYFMTMYMFAEYLNRV